MPIARRDGWRQRDEQVALLNLPGIDLDSRNTRNILRGLPVRVLRQQPGEVLGLPEHGRFP